MENTEISDLTITEYDAIMLITTNEHYYMEVMRLLYVAYGSNMNLEQMDWRCPNSKIVGNGVIKDWRLVFNTHANIIPSKGSVVPVVVWDVPKEDWYYLDVYEGYPEYYVKEDVTVNMDDGSEERCVVYVMADDNKGFCPPFEDYWQTIMEGYADNGIDNTSALYSALAESWEKYEEENYAKTEK